MSLENAPPQGITLYSHADDFRSHWIRYVLAEKQIKYNLVLTDEDDEDLASLNPYNQLPMLVENELKLFKASIISEYIDDRYRQNKLYADADINAQKKAQSKLRDTLVSLTPLFQHFPFFMSEHFSILDCMLAPIFLRLKTMGIILPQQHCRPIHLYCQRIFNRPAFVKSMTLQEKNRYSELLSN